MCFRFRLLFREDKKMVKNTKTISQFKITEWADENFISGSVEMTFTSDNSATITDSAEQSIKIIYDEKEGIKYE